MKNRIYYGEYSLAHWIKLMLTSNIVLPDYQRLFVWKEEDVKNFINQIKDDQYVPTLTIGHYVDSHDKRVNWILDGQQRLSSLLLAYLGLYPDKIYYKAKLAESFADDNDDEDVGLVANEEEIQEEFDDILNWQYSLLVGHGSNKKDILANLPEGNYKIVDYGVTDEFFEEHYIGFSYLVPQEKPNMQLRYYSTLFRNINRQGVALESIESRASLYYLEPELKDFFKPDFIEWYKIKLTSEVKKIDFVKYLSILSEYSKDEKKASVARGMRSSKIEEYYEDYINAVVLDSEDGRFKQFSSIFPDKKYQQRFDLLRQNLGKMDLPEFYDSIIDVDVYFFGIIYISVFKGLMLTDDNEKIERLKNRLQNKIRNFRGDLNHRKSPGGIGHLRDRLDYSIRLYLHYGRR